MLTVATWNLENLYRPGSEFGPTTEAIYEAKLEALAATIATIAPHVLAVQEVGQPEALGDLVERLEGDWTMQLSAAPDPRGIRVGFVTPLEVDDPETLAEFPPHLAPVQADDSGGLTTQMGRGALRITITSPAGNPVEVVTAHLKSKLLTYPGGRFTPEVEDERARYGAYALYRRAPPSGPTPTSASTGKAQHRRPRPWVAMRRHQGSGVETVARSVHMTKPDDQRDRTARDSRRPSARASLTDTRAV